MKESLILSFIPLFVAMDPIGIVPLYLTLTGELSHHEKRKAISSLGIFPIGTPIIVGPAVLTTLIILVDNHGFVPTLVSFGLNLIILGVALLKADIIFSVLGEGGARGFAKVMYMLLAAIGIMMVRRGVMELISDFRGL